MRATHPGPITFLNMEPTGRPIVMGGQEIF